MLESTARTLVRRWIALLVILIIAVFVACGVFVEVKPEQQNKAQVLFVPSLFQAGVDGATNPFLSLGGSAAIVASVTSARVSGTVIARQLQSAGATGKYTVVPNLAENAGPVLLVTVEDTSAAVSSSTMAAVLRVIRSQLRSVQVSRDVPKRLLITSLVLTSSTRPTVVRKSQIQDTVAAFAAVTLLLVAGLVAFDRRQETRARRRPDPASAEAELALDLDNRASDADAPIVAPALLREHAKPQRSREPAAPPVQHEHAKPPRPREQAGPPGPREQDGPPGPREQDGPPGPQLRNRAVLATTASRPSGGDVRHPHAHAHAPAEKE